MMGFEPTTDILHTAPRRLEMIKVATMVGSIYELNLRLLSNITVLKVKNLEIEQLT